MYDTGMVNVYSAKKGCNIDIDHGRGHELVQRGHNEACGAEVWSNRTVDKEDVTAMCFD